MHVSVRRSGPFLILLGLMLAGFAGSAVAQGTSGKIQGRVVDAESGNPVAGAQVVILGSRLGNLSDPQGYYFINNVPAGLYNIQAQYIGYQTTTVQGQRVNAGYTTTVNFRLSLQAVAIEAITVQGESAPITPRDKTVSGNVVTGDVVSQLPVDNMNQVVALTPGVINYGGQFVIRGGRAGEASVYIDGVLVRNFNAGDQGRIQLGTNAVEEVNVLTGGFGAEFGQAQSGVVSYVTKSGGQRYTGSLAFQTDKMMPNSVRYGQSRLEANIGGPIIPSRLSFNVALAAEGAEDSGRRFLNMAGADSLPVQKHFFEPTGLTPLAGTTDSVMGYKSLGDLGNRLPWNNGDNYTANATLRWDPTKTTKLTFGGITNRAQSLGYSYARQFIPNSISAGRSNSNLLRVGLEQILFQSAERQAVIRLNGAYQDDQSRSGQLADTSALTPPGSDFMGFTFSPYKFFFDGKFTMDRYLARFDSVKLGQARPNGQVPDILTGVETLDCGGTPCTVAFGDRFFNAVEGNDNPLGYTAGGVYTRGLNGWGYSGEKTYSLNGALDLQANRLHRIGAGFELYKKTVDNQSAGISSTYFHNVYRVKPTIAGAYIKDRMDIGEMVLDAGVRFDYYSSDAKFPEIPGLVLPFEPDSPDSPLCAPNTLDQSGKCQPNFVKQDAIWTWSPRLGVAFPISTSTNFRLSYGHFFQLPAFNILYSSINTDLSRSNTNTAYGRPIDPMKTVQFEVGVTHFFNPFTVLDVTAYDKSKLADATYRIVNYTMPKSQHGNQDLRVLTGLDYGSNRGADLRLTRRYGRYFTAILGYSYLDAKGTGSDPGSYIYSFGRYGDAFGRALAPAQAIQTLDMDQTHRLTVAATADFGKDIGEGTVWNPILKATTVALTMTAGSGLPWTTSSTPGLRGRPTGTGSRFTELINSSRLPWTYNIDGRLSRGVNIGSQKIAIFADVRNLLNTRFTTNVFGVNGSAVDPGDIAANSSFSGPTVTISTTTDPVAKLAYQRQKDFLTLYGLADTNSPDVLTHDEQVKLRALQYIQSQWLPSNFSAPRRIQLGAEWVF